METVYQNTTAADVQTKNDLALFSEKVNAVLTSKFIISENRIAELLKFIVTTASLTVPLRKTLKDFSYPAELARNRLVLSDEPHAVRSKLSLPVERGRLFAFVFCLLAEFDTHKREFSSFVLEYFYDEDINIAYERFLDEVIRPFKKAGEYMLREIDPDSLDGEALKGGEDFFKAERVYISTSGYEKMITALHFFKKKLDTEIPASAGDKAEAKEVADGLTHALMSKNPKLIRLMWLAFKNSCVKLKGAEKFVNDIREQLTLNNLL